MVIRFIDKNGRKITKIYASFLQENVIHSISNEIDTLWELTQRGCKSTPKLIDSKE